MQVKFQGITFLSGPREKVQQRHAELARQLREEQGQKSCLYYLDTTFGDKFTYDKAALLDEKEELALLRFAQQEMADLVPIEIPPSPTREDVNNLLYQLRMRYDKQFNSVKMKYMERHKDVDAYGQPTQHEELT